MSLVDRVPATTGTSGAAADWLERDADVLAPVLSRNCDVVAAEAHGSWITDVEGRRYLDFACGIAVTNLGHGHPEVVAAAHAQLDRLVHTSVTVHHTPAIALAERLRRLLPEITDAQAFFCNTGAECVDGAIKLARQATRRPGVIAFRGGFHGRTLAATSLTTTKAVYRRGYEPLLGGVHIAPYGDASTWKHALAQLDELLHAQAPADTIAAMIVEPVLGEGGYRPAAPEFLSGLRDRCDEHGILLVFDEVQTGVGRTGAFAAYQRYGVTPDVLLLAKGIANGLPLGAIVASRELMARWPTMAHGTTFGGNPVSCAAASAVLDVIERDGIAARAARLGEEIVARLRNVTATNRTVVDVRGLGMMVGVELASADAAHAVADRCLADGLLVLTCGVQGNVLRLIPPLTIGHDELALGLDILGRALAAVAVAV